MASVTNWIEHLTTDVDAATEGVQVADIYPMVGTEWMWLTVAIIFWLWFPKLALQTQFRTVLGSAFRLNVTLLFHSLTLQGLFVTAK